MTVQVIYRLDAVDTDLLRKLVERGVVRAIHRDGYRIRITYDWSDPTPDMGAGI